MSLGLNFTGNKLQTLYFTTLFGTFFAASLSLYPHPPSSLLSFMPSPTPLPSAQTCLYLPIESTAAWLSCACRGFFLGGRVSSTVWIWTPVLLPQKGFLKTGSDWWSAVPNTLPDTFIACIIAYNFLITFCFTIFYFPY